MEDSGIFNGERKFVDFKGTFKGEGNYSFLTDAEARKFGERTRLVNLVVHTVNDEY